MSLAWAAYRLVAPAIGALAPHARLFASPDERPLWGERMGSVATPEPCDAWIHAASLGEAGAAVSLVRELLALEPSSRLRLTATTRTGRAKLAALGVPVSLAPIDSPQAVTAFLRAVRPRRLFVIETEIWPHWLLAAKEAHLPVIFVSARMSEDAARGYAVFGSALRGLMASVELALCQSGADAERWISIGVPRERTRVTGNLKFDSLPSPAADRALARAALGLDAARPLLTLGSVRPGEVRIIARAWNALPADERARWQVVAVPRHMRAASELLAEARSEGLTSVSAEPGATPETRVGDRAWRWDAQPGVLNAYYAASEVAFVGASLVPLGGHNPLEPAACGAAVLMGPHGRHQRDAIAALQAHRGIRIATVREFGAALEALILDEAQRRQLSAGGRAAVEAMRGATKRSLRELVALRLWPIQR
jgi:3-deoxy-D-manno-octulosonic-acid transferase